MGEIHKYMVNLPICNSILAYNICIPHIVSNHDDYNYLSDD